MKSGTKHQIIAEWRKWTLLDEQNRLMKDDSKMPGQKKIQKLISQYGSISPSLHMFWVKSWPWTVFISDVKNRMIIIYYTLLKRTLVLIEKSLCPRNHSKYSHALIHGTLITMIGVGTMTIPIIKLRKPRHRKIKDWWSCSRVLLFTALHSCKTVNLRC